MRDQSQDIGVATALVERLNKERLPRALALKEKVDRGETLDDSDIAFLEKVFADVRTIEPLLNRNPQYQDIAGRMARLYKEITDKALQNEEAKGSSKQ